MLHATRLLLSLLALTLVLLAHTQPAPLTVVGVLGNTAGMSDHPLPYAFYTGIGLDARGRLYLAGAADGVPVCDQDGQCLALVPVPQAEGMTLRSLVARAGEMLFFVGSNPGSRRSALYRLNTAPADPAQLKLERLLAGPGLWVLSQTLAADGKIVLGQSDLAALRYHVLAVDPASGQPTPLFDVDMPAGATTPWRHLLQVESDGTVSITHSGGANWAGRYRTTGERIGDVLPGMLIGGFRYTFNYEGGLRRTDLAGAAAPGDCGSPCPEIRMAAQMVQAGERYFFAGRGGAVEARWTGTNFLYTRRIGAVSVDELFLAEGTLTGIAFTANGNNDVQHPLALPLTQPIGQLLRADGPLHSKQVATAVAAPNGRVFVSRVGREVRLTFDGPAYLEYTLACPMVQEIGQAAVQGKDLLLADPKAGTLWHRPLLDKTAPLTAWKRDLPGVLAIAVTPQAVFVATATRVTALSPDGAAVRWTAPDTYKGIRRLAATPTAVYVCDTAGHVVDQLDAATGALVARLGVPGEAGATLTHLARPTAVAADPNGVYIADPGNGRVLVATTTLWRPELPRLPREDTAPLVAARVPVKAPTPGRLSVNIYDQHDVTVRQLACAQPSDQPVLWDGKDQYGRWAKPGTYRYHGILAPKLSLKYLTSLGQSGTPPYRTADGKGSWGGVWGDVMDICPVSAAPGADIIVLWAFEEGEGGLIRMSPDGVVRWKAHLDWWMKASQMAVACDGTSVFVACASAMGAPDGQGNYHGTFNRPMLWRVDAATGAKRLYAPATQPQPMFGDYLDAARIVTDLAVRDGKLYLTAPASNALFVADAQSGAQLARWPLTAASGVACLPDGTLRAGSGTTLVVLDAAGAVTRTLADLGGEVWDLEALADGTLVASVGAPRHQVVYLSAAGTELRALGAKGGRPLCGKMQPANLLQPTGLCATGAGTLFLAEHSAPRRFTRWSATGALERQFHGPYYFSGMFGIDDEHPESVYADSHRDLIRYTVDYTTGQWDVDAYWTDAYGQSGVPIKWWPRIRHRDGKTYWCSGSGAIVELLADRVRGVAAVYGGYVEKQPDGGYLERYHTQKTGLMGTWSDLNGDGQKQPEEWQVTDKPAYPLTGGGPQQGWGTYFDERFDLYMHDWSDSAVGGIWKIPVAEWRNGVPVYKWEQAVQVGGPRGNGLNHGANGARTAFAAAGGVYGFNGGYNAAGLPGVGHGHDWEFAQITRYDPETGRPVWHAGQRCAGFVAPGEHYCPTGAAGLLNGCLFWTDENSLVHVWDATHGLYVDTLLDDTMRDPKPGPTTVWVELFNTRVLRHPVTGKVYLYAGSDAIHVYEVLGLEQPMPRLSGTVTLTAEGLAAAQAREAARVVAGVRTLAIRRGGPVTVDGDLREFAAAPAATLALTPTAQGTARLLRDAQNLYVAFDVRDDSPWTNAGGDPTAFFKSGDSVDLWLGPSAGKRPAGLGDVRVLFAPAGEKPTAVLYRPKVAQGAKPVVFRSPAGQLTLDLVQVNAPIPVAVQTTTTGYRLEAAIPWTLLGLDPAAARLGLDLSINFSDPAGQRNVARLHWGRNGAAIVYDLPTEARFEPELWGEGVLE
jgi:hypothetical protein